ncbi:MAG TPA: acylphosphatase [Burkholderiales bacterium]|nr:acylphosphatase [Burkholderiales bacterium]
MQGVGFRDALCEEARRLGVRGWVRNRPDGTVEATLQGPGQAVDDLLAWARIGPPHARVRSVEVHAVEGAEPLEGFHRLPTPR